MKLKTAITFTVVHALVLLGAIIFLVIALLHDTPVPLVGCILIVITNAMSFCRPILEKSKKMFDYVLPTIGLTLAVTLLLLRLAY